jgi:hypothetical protein
MIAKILFLLRRGFDTERIEANFAAIDGTCLIVETPALENMARTLTDPVECACDLRCISPTLDPIAAIPRRAHSHRDPGQNGLGCFGSMQSAVSLQKSQASDHGTQKNTACGLCPKISIRLAQSWLRLGSLPAFSFLSKVGNDDI